MGLPRSARMGRPDFRRTTGRGPRASAGPLVMQVMRAGPGRSVAAPVKVGFAVGRPVGGAVTRNVVRRRLREAAAAALPLRTGEAAEPTLVLVRARPGAESLTLVELTGLMADAWRRVAGPSGGRG